jgi:hypothetical protein
MKLLCGRMSRVFGVGQREPPPLLMSFTFRGGSSLICKNVRRVARKDCVKCLSQRAPLAVDQRSRQFGETCITCRARKATRDGMKPRAKPPFGDGLKPVKSAGQPSCW